MTQDEKEEYLRQMEAERGYILGWHQVLAEYDLEFLKSYNGLLAAAYTKPRLLDARTKEFALTAALIVARSTPDHITTHLKVLKRLGVTAQECLEFLEVLLPPAGVPAFMGAFDLWREVYEIPLNR